MEIDDESVIEVPAPSEAASEEVDATEAPISADAATADAATAALTPNAASADVAADNTEMEVTSEVTESKEDQIVTSDDAVISIDDPPVAVITIDDEEDDSPSGEAQNTDEVADHSETTSAEVVETDLVTGEDSAAGEEG